MGLGDPRLLGRQVEWLGAQAQVVADRALQLGLGLVAAEGGLGSRA